MRLVLCTNGTVVVERGGQYLMDAGISFAAEKWHIWGQQVRNARPAGPWEQPQKGALKPQGLLWSNWPRKPLIKFVETVARQGTEARITGLYRRGARALAPSGHRL